MAVAVRGLFAISKTPDPNAVLKAALQQLSAFVEVTAVPGSGKTSALLDRLVWLIESGVSPSKILVMSFAKKSVAHFRSRLVPATESVTVTTGHAFGLGVVKTNTRLLGLRNMPKVQSGKAVTAMLAKAVSHVGKDVVKGLKNKSKRKAARAWFDSLTGLALSRLQTLLEIRETSGRKLSKLVARSPFAEWAPQLDNIKLIRREFKRRKAKAGVIHFADMIGLATRAIRAGGDFGGYTHVLADEYQDCSPQQVAMLAALAARTRSAVVAGDPLQAIYGWAGSRYTRFKVEGQPVARLQMSYSHRLTAANAVFACVLMGMPVDAIQTGRTGTVPVLYESQSHVQQARQIAEQIRQLVDQGTSPARIAVLGRQKKQLRALHAGLLGHVLCRLTDLTDDEEDAARTAPMDVIWLLAWIRSDERKASLTGEHLRAKFQRYMPADTNWDQAAKDLRAIRSPSLEGRLLQVNKVYLRLLGGQLANKHTRNRLNLWTAVARGLKSIVKLKALVKAQAVLSSVPAVTLSSIHAAKGGQWNEVFVLGATDGVLPDYRSQEGQALEEERRLLYVASTRARRTLQLYQAPHLLKTGEMAEVRSRLLEAAIRVGALRVANGQ